MASNHRGPGLLAAALSASLLLQACTEPRDAGRQQATTAGQTSTEQPIATTNVHVSGDDYTLSGPYAHSNLEIFLVHGKTSQPSLRKILTLEEAMAKGLVKVHETGDVQQLAIENLAADADVYVQSGDIVQGGKQDRVLASDLLVSAKSGKVPLASFCVEEGRWGVRGNGQSAAQGTGSSLLGSLFSSSRNAVSSGDLKRAVRLSNSQQEVWNEVKNTQRKLAANVEGDVIPQAYATSLEMTLNGKSVRDAIAAHKAALGSILEGKKDVVGYAFAINGRVNSAEIYASADLFRRLWNKQLQATAVEAVAELAAEARQRPATKIADVQAFLAVHKGTEGRCRDVDRRVQVVTVDAANRHFTETRDKANASAWVHRSYLAR